MSKHEHNTEFAAWVTVDGEQWDYASSATAADRDEEAAEFAARMRKQHYDLPWRVWVGESTPTRDITPETSRLYASSED